MGQPRLDTNDFLSPIVLTADSFTLPVDAEPLSTQLLNPNRTAMLVDEFRFGTGFDVAAGATLDNDFAQIVADIKLGGAPLTNGETPIRSFMPTYTQTTTVSFAVSDRQLTWHLPRPMYVPPNVQLHVKFRRKLPTGWSINDANAAYNFSIAGRSIPSGMQVPDKIYVPWAAAMAVFTDASLPFTSNNAAVANPHDEALHMSYLCGYSYNSVQGSTIRMPVTVQASFSNGKLLIRDPTPFYALFPPDRPVMRLDGLLQPKQFVQFFLDMPTTSVLYPNLIFTTIGLVGYRQVQTPQGAQP